MLWVRISIRARCTTLCNKVCQLLAAGLWFSPGSPVSSTNKTDRHDITEILLKVALNTIKQTKKALSKFNSLFISISWYTSLYSRLLFEKLMVFQLYIGTLSIWKWNVAPDSTYVPLVTGIPCVIVLTSPVCIHKIV